MSYFTDDQQKDLLTGKRHRDMVNPVPLESDNLTSMPRSLNNIITPNFYNNFPPISFSPNNQSINAGPLSPFINTHVNYMNMDLPSQTLNQTPQKNDNSIKGDEKLLAYSKSVLGSSKKPINQGNSNSNQPLENQQASSRNIQNTIQDNSLIGSEVFNQTNIDCTPGNVGSLYHYNQQFPCSPLDYVNYIQQSFNLPNDKKH